MSKTFFERFEDKFCVMLERYTAEMSRDEAEKKIIEIENFFCQEIESLIEKMQDLDDYPCEVLCSNERRRGYDQRNGEIIELLKSKFEIN